MVQVLVVAFPRLVFPSAASEISFGDPVGVLSPLSPVSPQSMSPVSPSLPPDQQAEEDAEAALALQAARDAAEAASRERAAREAQAAMEEQLAAQAERQAQAAREEAAREEVIRQAQEAHEETTREEAAAQEAHAAQEAQQQQPPHQPGPRPVPPHDIWAGANPVGSIPVDQVFNALDVNGDGVLDRDEFAQGFAHQPAPLSARTEHAIQWSSTGSREGRAVPLMYMAQTHTEGNTGVLDECTTPLRLIPRMLAVSFTFEAEVCIERLTITTPGSGKGPAAYSCSITQSQGPGIAHLCEGALQDLAGEQDLEVCANYVQRWCIEASLTCGMIGAGAWRDNLQYSSLRVLSICRSVDLPSTSIPHIWNIGVLSRLSVC